MSSMTPGERVHAAVKGEPVDRYHSASASLQTRRVGRTPGGLHNGILR